MDVRVKGVVVVHAGAGGRVSAFSLATSRQALACLMMGDWR
jgi:hypothetical protein